MTHLGLHLGDCWTLALLRRGESGGAPGTPGAETNGSQERTDLPAPFSPALGTGQRGGPGAGTVPSPADTLAGLGLTSHLVETDTNLYLLRGEADDSPPQVLPGTGPARAGVITTNWPRLIESRCDPGVLELCATQHLLALASRLEDGTGSRSAPCDTCTISVDGSGSVAFYEAVARAAATVFGVWPTFLWAPTAVAGWALVQPAVQTNLIAGRSVATAVVNTSTTRTSAPPPLTVNAQHVGGEIRTSIRTTEAPAASAGPRVRYAEAGRGRCAALGAALWGWWRCATGRRHVDAADGADIHFVLIGSGPTPSSRGESEESSPAEPIQSAERNVPLLEVTPPDPAEAAELPGTRCLWERRQPRWFARAVQVQGELFGPVPLKVCARFPWSGSGLVVADFLFPMDEVRARWRGRFSVAVRFDPAGNAGAVSLIRPESAEYVDTPFALLPTAEAGQRASRPTDPSAGAAGGAGATYATVREAFRSLPSALECAWSVDPPAESLLLLGADWRVVPQDYPRPLELDVLRFSPEVTRLSLRVRSGSDGAREPLAVAVEETISGGLQRYRVPLSAALATVSAGESIRERSWSVCIEPVAPRQEPRSAESSAGDATANGKAAVDSDPAPGSRSSLGGALLLAPPAYGLLAELRWDQGQQDVAAPYPVGRRADQRSARAVPMAVGYRADADGMPMAAVPLTGRLVLSNLWTRPLLVRLSPGDSIRVAATEWRVAPGARTEVPVQRRRTVSGRDVPRFRDVEVVCRVEPVAGEGRTSGSEGAGVGGGGTAFGAGGAQPLGPPVEVMVGMGERRAKSPTLCLPGDATIDLDLPSWLPPGSWRLPVEVAGAAAAELVVGPAGLAELGVGASVPAAPDGRSAARSTAAELRAQPVVLLDWFPLPMGALSGELEFRHCPADRMDPSALAIPYPFRARISGAFAVARSLEVRYAAGLSFSLPFDLLASDDAPAQPLVRWRWESAAAAPYEMACELLTDAPPDSSPVDDTPGFPLDPPRFNTTSLSAAALAANTHGHRPRWLRVRPQGPTGWEQGSWRAALVLAAPDGRVLDEVNVSYAVAPLAPRLGVRIGSEVDVVGNPVLEYAVHNVNPFRAVIVVGLNLSAEVRLKGLKVEDAAAVFDDGGKSGGRVEAGTVRIWTGRLSAGRNRLLRSLRRVPGLAGFVGYAGKKAHVDLRLRAVCEGRSDRPYTYRARGEVEIV